jgi:hypothetical protein
MITALMKSTNVTKKGRRYARISPAYFSGLFEPGVGIEGSSTSVTIIKKSIMCVVTNIAIAKKQKYCI